MVKNLFLKHFPAVVLACFVVMIIYLPQHLLKQDAGAAWRGVAFTASDSEFYYNARIQDVYDGHFKAANAFLAEYKSLPYIQPPLPEIITAALGQLTFQKASFDKAFAASRVIIPFLLTLVIYVFVVRLTGSRLQALIGAALIMLGLEVLQNWRLVLDFVQFQFPNFAPNIFSRPVSPQMGLLFFFLYLIFFWEWLKQTPKNSKALAAGVILGLSFYVYFYTWAFVIASNGILALYFLLSRNLTRLKQLVLLHLVAVLVAIPYFYNLYQFSQQENRDYLAFHAGMFASHRFYMNWTVVAYLALLILLRQKDRLRFVWFTSMLAGGFLALNQQVITGQELTPAHFHWYFISVIAGLVALFALFEVFRLEEHKRLKYVISLVILVFLIGTGFAKQLRSYQHYKVGFLQEQRFGPLHEWLNQNTPKDSVVLTVDRNQADRVAAYTHNNVYYSSFMFLSNTPSERLRDMHYLSIRLSGVKLEEAESYFRANPHRVADLLGGFSTRRIYGCRTCFAEEEYGKAAETLREYLRQDLSSQLDKYQLDYIVIDQRNDLWRPEGLPRAQFLSQVKEFKIYRYAQN